MSEPKLRRRLPIPVVRTERTLDGLILFLATMGVSTWAGTIHGSAAFLLGFGFAGLVWLWVRDWR